MTRDDIIREADAWLKMNGRASDGQTCFLMALFAQHIAALAASKQKPSGYAYRYADGALRFNNGCAVNGGPPVEAVPYWFAPPALVAAAEREACARVCEPQSAHDDPLTAWKIAAAIRARGEGSR